MFIIYNLLNYADIITCNFPYVAKRNGISAAALLILLFIILILNINKNIPPRYTNLDTTSLPHNILI